MIIKREILKEKKVERNIRIFTLSSLDVTAMIVPVITLIWLEVSLSFGEMLLLQGIFAISILVTEIPSGAFADTYSRKITEVIAHFLLGIALVSYVFSDCFLHFAIAECLAGIGVALSTGAASSLVYDSMKEVDRDDYQAVISRMLTLTFVVAAVATITGGFLGTVHLRIPMVIPGLFHFGLAILALLYIEPQREKAESVSVATKRAVQLSYTNPVLLGVLLISISGGVISRICFWAYSPIFLNMGLTSVHLGFLLAGFNVVAAIGSMLVRRANKESTEKVILGMIVLVEIVTALALSMWSTIQWGILVAICVQQVVRGIRGPLIAARMQSELSSEERTTFISLSSSLNALLFSMVSILIEIFQVSMEETLHSMAILGFIIAVFYLILLIGSLRTETQIQVPS